ncbi:adenosylcobinamide-GDP ribazoletransferase [Corynebacterium gerontici]|uniref:Adenosylcobinamide-GDP ribazoletransferase n=1 Tax=Corynebacterium gerontici TaxID=2079234 RepID=A0A3G6J1A6_9CORY|nr:adenosylcobinamide-GDP ribazoletransferase [Corynebacterium gerontici]AZA11805.1 Cobalamin synthase [Corynebacterium gerontici]
MSDKVDFVEGSHGIAFIEGPSTALSWLTILPIKGASAFDRITGRRVICSVPFVGMVYGLLAALVIATGVALGTSALLIAVLAVVAMELFGRFMHLDGLGDVADALGSYAQGEKARSILSDPHIGLIGAGAGLLSLLAQVASISALISSELPFWQLMLAVIAGPSIGRLGVLFVCHNRYAPMRPGGFGAQIIGTVLTWHIVAWLLGYALLFALIALISLGLATALLLTLVLVAVAGALLAAHCNRRFEGLNGDCCGFVIHLCTTIALVLLAM